MRASSLSYNTIAVNREIDSAYDAVLEVKDNLTNISIVAGLDIDTILADLQDAKDFTGIKVAVGSVASWDSATKTITVPTVKGDTGDKGDNGVDGVQGPSGETGPRGDTGISVHHSRATSTTNLEGNFSISGETDTYTIYGDADETIVLGEFSVSNGSSAFTYAVLAGYAGTSTQFYSELAAVRIYSEQAQLNANSAAASASQAVITTGQATTAASASSSSASSASASASTSTTKASEALSSANSASNSATNASTSASAASVSASTSATKATEAATSASTALGYKNDVSTMKLAIETIYDTFDDRFLGTKTTNPLVDNDGNTLLDGALYFDTTTNAMKVYDIGTTTWYSIPQIYLSSLLDVQLTSINTGDILVWNGTKWSNTANPKVDSLQLNGGSGTEGTISWNSTEQTLDITQDGTTLQVGQELQYIVRNTSGSTIANGTFVGFAGVTSGSNRIIAAPFNTSTMTAIRLIGFATEDIANGVNGRVTNFGYVRGLDTRGTAVTGMSVGDEDWSDGDVLYVHPTAAGKLTKVAPTSGVKAPVATVTNRHQAAGELFVNVIAVDQLKIDHGEVAYNKTTNIDNTSDLNKPVSTAVQTALDLKAPLDSAALVNPTINGIAQSGYTGFKNYIINGNFDIWQRGNGPFINYIYGADRWVCYHNTAAMNSSNTSSNGIQKRIAHIQDVTAGGSFLAQAIELPLVGFGHPFTIGKKFTVSVRYSSTTKISPRLIFRDGVVGAHPVNLDSTMTSPMYKGGSSVAETVSWTFNVDGAVVSTNSCLVLSLHSESASSNVYMFQVQLEEGSVATPFEQRPIGLEFSLCQRYYEVGRIAVYNNTSLDSATNGAGINFQTRKRVTPTLLHDISGLTIQNPDSIGFEFFKVVDYGLWITGYYNASAEL